jgi:predicted Zn-dependent protease
MTQALFLNRFGLLCLFCLLVSLPVLADEKMNARDKFIFNRDDLELLKEINAMDQKLERKGRIYEEAALEQYVNQIAQTLVPPDPLENVTWKFRILRDPEVNAFAFPNGSIYLYTGLLAQLENESQLASVLAHEITHVCNRHTYLAVRSYRKKMLTANIIGLVSGEAGTLAALINSFTIAGYSRELEREADEEGFAALIGAKYDPRGMVGAFQSLLKKYDVDLSFDIPFWRTHPRLEERIRSARELLVKNKAAELSAEAFREQQQRLETLTEICKRENVRYAIEDGFYRTALAHAQQLRDRQPSAANLTALADAYAGLGPRTVTPTAKELSGGGKREARRMQSRMLLDEATKKLLEESGGRELQKQNFMQAEALYRQSLELDESYALAYRGLAELYEKQQQPAKAALSYRRYIEFQPDAADRLMVIRRIKNLESSLIPSPSEERPKN